MSNKAGAAELPTTTHAANTAVSPMKSVVPLLPAAFANATQINSASAHAAQELADEQGADDGDFRFSKKPLCERPQDESLEEALRAATLDGSLSASNNMWCPVPAALAEFIKSSSSIHRRSDASAVLPAPLGASTADSRTSPTSAAHPRAQPQMINVLTVSTLSTEGPCLTTPAHSSRPTAEATKPQPAHDLTSMFPPLAASLLADAPDDFTHRRDAATSSETAAGGHVKGDVEDCLAIDSTLLTARRQQRPLVAGSGSHQHSDRSLTMDSQQISGMSRVFSPSSGVGQQRVPSPC